MTVTAIPHLTHAHQNTFDAIMSRPTRHNIHWRDVLTMLSALATVEPDKHGGSKVTLAGHSLTIHPGTHAGECTSDQLADLRTFLLHASPSSASSAPILPATTPAAGLDLLVVIDHRQARIYQAHLRGGTPERISPYDPDASGKSIHFIHDNITGQNKPELKSYYHAIAAALSHADRILIFGSGTGTASAMEHLVGDLARHHPAISARVVGSTAVDEHHLTEPQLLAKARDFYSNLPAPKRASSHTTI